MIVLLAIVQVM